MNNIKLSHYPYTLELKHPFGISDNTRTTTPAVLVEIKYEEFTGYGEASLPPYLLETQESVQFFLSQIDLSSLYDITDIDSILSTVDNLAQGNNAAKASFDIALHDLVGKIKKLPVYKMYNIPKRERFTSYTIGIDSTEMLLIKLKEAENFKFIKAKLGTLDDKKIINTIRSETDKPIFADINQGWSDREAALDLTLELAENNVLLIEQPFSKLNYTDTAWLTSRSPIPVIADEAVKRLSDLDEACKAYSGVNIKLMKSTGISEAYKMIIRARELNLKVMLGCMTETTCAISAAAHLCSLADWVDLDGNLLINNDLFDGVNAAKGTIVPNDLPGLGIRKISQ
ncbi:MAG: dipeptide epimerase [Ignavibacteriaceae bacterium]|nr:dipeptide epimerase [Ignavibacteriaceae bacterium]